MNDELHHDYNEELHYFHQIGREILKRSRVENEARPNTSAKYMNRPLRIKGMYEPPVKEAVQPRVSRSLRRSKISGRTKVKQEKACRVCKGNHSLTRHHVVPISWFIGKDPDIQKLRDLSTNIIPLCDECHRVVDGVRDPVGRLQKRAAIREALGTNEYAFVIQMAGQAWLNENYPKNP